MKMTSCVQNEMVNKSVVPAVMYIVQARPRCLALARLYG